MSNQGPEAAVSSQSQAASDSMDDVLPPPTHASAVTAPTHVAEGGPPESGRPTSTGREGERMSHRTSPCAPLRTRLPEHAGPMQPPLNVTPSLPRIPSTQTHGSSNAVPSTFAAQSMATPHGRAEGAGPLSQVATRGLSPCQYKSVSILRLLTHFLKINPVVIDLLKEIRLGFGVDFGVG
jgi:hypothetical protein